MLFQIDINFLHLIKDQGMQLERTCAFASALKYYFAGVQYFKKKEKRKEALNVAAERLRDKFKELYEKLIPMTNAEVPTPCL